MRGEIPMTLLIARDGQTTIIAAWPILPRYPRLDV
jgi:hypothetical protein